jgi:pilus assembly protein CpaE
VSKPVRVIVLNVDEEATAELRAHLLSIEGVKIVAEIDEPAMLAHAIGQFPAEVLLVHLDPNPNAIMGAIAPVIAAQKDAIASIGMTEDRDAELVMRAMRAGMREFLWKPFPPEQLVEILGRMAREAPSNPRRLGRLIPVMATTGGAGATTLATNLAVELAQIERGKDVSPGDGRLRVAVVDLDFRFGQVAMFLDAQPTYTIAELCESTDHIEPQMIERVLVKHPSGVHVLAQPASIEQAQRISAAQCASALSALLEHYDFVVCDGPTRFDPTARAVFDMTDVYLLVLQLVVPAVRNTDRILHELNRSGYNLDKVRLICNRFGRDAGHLEPADVEATLGRRIAWALPDDWKTSSTAANIGAPLLDHAPRSKLRAAYQQIASNLAGSAQTGGESEEVGGPADLRKSGGLLSFFGAKSVTT